MVRFRRTGGATLRATAVAAWIELVVLAALLVFLGIAAGKLFLILGRLGVPLWKGAPLGLLFGLAAAFTARRISARVRGLRRGGA